MRREGKYAYRTGRDAVARGKKRLLVAYFLGCFSFFTDAYLFGYSVGVGVGLAVAEQSTCWRRVDNTGQPTKATLPRRMKKFWSFPSAGAGAPMSTSPKRAPLLRDPPRTRTGASLQSPGRTCWIERPTDGCPRASCLLPRSPPPSSARQATAPVSCRPGRVAVMLRFPRL